MKKILYTAALLAVAAGCAKEMDFSAPVEGNLVPYTFQANLEQTKAEIANDGVFSWSAGDQIAVFNTKDSKFYTFTAAAADGSFSGTAPEGASFSVAYYPASVAGTAENEVVLPDTYSQADAAAGKLFPMVADATASTLTFSHLGALLRLTVNDVPANATSLVLSSDATIAGSFTPAEVSGKQVISAGGAASSVTVALSNDAKTNLTLTLPVPTGTFNYTLSLGDGTTEMLSKGTTSAKSIARASLHKMSALTVAYPTTENKLIGYFKYNHQDSDWSSSILAPFETTDSYGWLKVSNLVMRESHVSFKLFNSGTYTGITGENGRRILKTLSSVAAAGQGVDITYYASAASIDVYYNTTNNQLFALPGGSDFYVPTVGENTYADSFALIGSTGADNWSKDLYFEPVEADASWRVIKNIAPNEENKYALKFRQNGDWAVQFGKYFSNDKTASTVVLMKQGGNDIIFNNLTGANDIYLSTDMKRLFILPAGSPFSVPADYDGDNICLIGYFCYDGGILNEWNTDLHVSPVAGHPGWFVRENVTFGTNSTGFQFKFREPNSWSWTAGFANADTVNPNAWFDMTVNNPQNCTISSAANHTDYDIYVNYDLSKVGVFEHGTSVSFPE